jgi:hypothetical protein
VSTYTEISDSVQFTDQSNEYKFTPPRDGKYRFEITGLTRGGNNSVNMSIYTIHGEYVSASSGGFINGNGLTVNLKAEDSYLINISQRMGLDKYQLMIMNVN